MISPSPLIATLLQSLTPASGNGSVSGEAFPGVARLPESPLAPEFTKSTGAPLPEAGQDLPALLDDSSRFALAIAAHAPRAGLPEDPMSGAESQSTPDAATPRRGFSPTPNPGQPAELAESVIALPVPTPAAPKSRDIHTSANPDLPAATGDEREADIGPVMQAEAAPTPIANALPVSLPAPPIVTSERADLPGSTPKIAAIRDASDRQPVTPDRPSPVPQMPRQIDATATANTMNGSVGDSIPSNGPSTPATTDPVSRAALPNLPVAVERSSERGPVGRADVAPTEPAQMAKSAPVEGMVSIALERIKAETTAETSTAIGSSDLARPAAANGASSIGFNFGVQPGILAPTSDTAAQILSMDRSQAAIDRQLDLSTASAWLDDLARDISAAVATREKLSFSLSPEHLGRMDVELSTSDAGVTVGFRSDNADARAIIAQAQPRLADELRNNGLRLADTQIFSGTGQEREGNRSAQHQAERTTIVEAAGWMPSETEEEIATAPDGRFA